MEITFPVAGFLDGWVYDEKCLARLKQITGNILPVGNFEHYPQVQDALEALDRGDVSYNLFTFLTC